MMPFSGVKNIFINHNLALWPQRQHGIVLENNPNKAVSPCLNDIILIKLVPNVKRKFFAVTDNYNVPLPVFVFPIGTSSALVTTGSRIATMRERINSFFINNLL